jgi:PQQ-like domain
MTWWAGLAGIALSLLAGPVRADWPQFRHDAAHTALTDEALSPPLELRWRFEDVHDLDPLDLLSPDDEQYAFPVPPDPRQPAIRWQMYPVEDFPLLVATEDRVCLGRAVSGLTGLDGKTGDVIWHSERRARLIGAEEDLLVLVPFTAGRDPIVVCAVYAETGEVRWARPATSFTKDLNLGGGVLGVNGGLIVGRGVEEHPFTGSVPGEDGGEDAEYRANLVDSYLAWLNVSDGSSVMRHDCMPPGVPLLGGVASRYTVDIQAWGRDVLVMAHPGDRPTGRLGHWHPGPWALTSGGGVTPTPEDAVQARWGGPAALFEPLGLAVGFETLDNVHFLAGRDAVDGRLVWRAPVQGTWSGRHAPAGDERRAYLGLTDGIVYALDAGTGKLAWRCQVGEPLPPRTDRSVDCYAPVCSLASDTLWVVYRGKLLALDLTTGEIEWETDETEAAWYEPVISNGMIYLLTCRGVEAWAPKAERGEGEDKPTEGSAGAARPE